MNFIDNDGNTYLTIYDWIIKQVDVLMAYYLVPENLFVVATGKPAERPDTPVSYYIEAAQARKDIKETNARRSLEWEFAKQAKLEKSKEFHEQFHVKKPHIKKPRRAPTGPHVKSTATPQPVFRKVRFRLADNREQRSPYAWLDRAYLEMNPASRQQGIQIKAGLKAAYKRSRFFERTFLDHGRSKKVFNRAVYVDMAQERRRQAVILSLYIGLGIVW